MLSKREEEEKREREGECIKMSGKILALSIKLIDNSKLETCIIARGEKISRHTLENTVSNMKDYYLSHLQRAVDKDQ